MSLYLSAMLLVILSPLAFAGLALMNTGLGRTRSAAHSMLSSLMCIAVAGCVFVLFGASWDGFAGGAAHSFVLGGKTWNWIGGQPVLLHGIVLGSSSVLAVLLQTFAVGFAALIPLAAGADRWRLNASLISTALFAGVTYPLFAHWVWGGGWLSQLGRNYGLGAGFLDTGGASTIHAAGGLTALAVVWVLGPRFGKYAEGSMPAAIPGHNIVYVLFGCLLMLPGWTAMNAAAALLFSQASLASVPLIALNTFLSAAASCGAAMLTTNLRFSKPDASLCGNGWVGGLVTSAALAAYITPGIAIFTGLIAGVIVTFSIEALELRFSVDDPGGAISAHGLAAIWGLLAAGIFARVPTLNGMVHPSGQFLAQVVGVATLLGFLLPLSYGLNRLLNYFIPLRVDRQGERLGMDLRELGGGAYPEFVVRTDEFSQR